MSGPAAPKTLADPMAVEHRRALVAEAPHLRPLSGYLEALRAAHGAVPAPDPLDGGAEARLLLLLEAPGPRIVRTHLVSRDNPTGTAANLFRYLAEAGLPRRDTLIWNAVPWVIHAPGAPNRAPTRAEVAAGLATLPRLLACLPRLRAVVLAGRVAGGAAPWFAAHRPDLALVAMPHPSPTYICTSPDVAARIRAALAEAAAALGQGHPGQGHPEPALEPAP